MYQCWLSMVYIVSGICNFVKAQQWSYVLCMASAICPACQRVLATVSTCRTCTSHMQNALCCTCHWQDLCSMWFSDNWNNSFRLVLLLSKTNCSLKHDFGIQVFVFYGPSPEGVLLGFMWWAMRHTHCIILCWLIVHKSVFQGSYQVAFWYFGCYCQI